MNRVINSFINTVKKIKSEIFGKISDFIFLYAEKIKSEIFVPFGHRITAIVYQQQNRLHNAK